MTHSRAPIYLTSAEITAINQQIMQADGLVSLVRDPEPLSIATLRPQLAAEFQGASIQDQASILMEGIIEAHAFVDGNKRTALLAGAAFLDLAGYQIVSDGSFGQAIDDLDAQIRAKSPSRRSFRTWVSAHTQVR